MRKQRQEEKRRQKAMGSSLIQSLRDELTERPTEETALGLPDEKVGMAVSFALARSLAS